MRLHWLTLLLPAALIAGSDALAATRLTVWDLDLGLHARELPVGAFADFACGTNGGPPSLPLGGWTDWRKCPAEPGSGLREVFFRYDDETQYVVRAMDPTLEGGYLPEGTSEFQIPLIVSALFDDHGFLAGRRIVTDPRTDPDTRERAYNLAGAYRARLGETGWTCVDTPLAEGETEYHGHFVKQRCERDDAGAGVRRTLEVDFFRKPGQSTIDPVTRVTTVGYFVSETRYQEVLLEPVANPAIRLMAIHPPPPTEVELLAAKVHDCPGCDLANADLKRADLRGANLAGANLTGANLHDALLAGADLTGARLVEANLNKADLRRAKLADADLSSAMLYEATLDGADLSRANLSYVAAGRVRMILATAPDLVAVNADFRYGRLSNSNLAGADLSFALLQEAQLTRVALDGADLSQATLAKASLVDVSLAGGKAVNADFTGANLRGADLTGADLSHANLRLATMAGVRSVDAVFEGARLPPGLR